MPAEKRVYTHVSGKALRGMQRLFADKDIYISPVPSEHGYTVVTKPKQAPAAKRRAGSAA